MISGRGAPCTRPAAVDAGSTIPPLLS